MLPTTISRAISAATGPIVFLTGAGISAESGVPTFRGPEGYWRVGSRNYQPTEMATARAFAGMPEEVWRWYLYRRGVCRSAAPNAAHRALVSLEQRLDPAATEQPDADEPRARPNPSRFLLVTQNVDGLHLRAGSSPERTYQIHGNIDFCRCLRGCAPLVRPLPPEVSQAWPLDRALTETDRAALRCGCGAWLRPHVLWFDESYDEPLFRYVSALRAAETAAALIVVGTSGATSLPTRICEAVAVRGAPFVVIDPEPTVFSELAESTARGLFLRGTASATLPELVDELAAAV
jgi:NAD-dependent deacetylase